MGEKDQSSPYAKPQSWCFKKRRQKRKNRKEDGIFCHSKDTEEGHKELRPRDGDEDSNKLLKVWFLMFKLLNHEECEIRAAGRVSSQLCETFTNMQILTPLRAIRRPRKQKRKSWEGWDLMSSARICKSGHADDQRWGRRSVIKVRVAPSIMEMTLAIPCSHFTEHGEQTAL